LRQNLARLGVDDPKVMRHLDKFSVEVQRSTKTISDLLELARNRPPGRHAVPAQAIVTQALSAANLPPEIIVEVNLPPQLTVCGDPDQLGRVLINLLVNGSQAMNGRGRIEIDGDATPAGTRLRVRDEGPGVPPEIHGRIFEALFTTKAKGSGLGLALCRRIAEAHGGTLALEPSSPGAAFVLTVPVVTEAPR
jgi:signal transduction histidine kinase